MPSVQPQPWTRRRIALFAAATLAAPLWMGVGARALAQPAELAFGLITVQSADQIVAMWAPVLGDLEDAVGMPVRADVFEDYAGVVWSLRSGAVQLAWTGNKAAIEAVDRAGAEVFAQRIDGEGREGYRSYLIARADSGLEDASQALARASELTLGTGDANSTSGSLVPGYYLFAANGLRAHDIFKRQIQGSHEENIHAVASGLADVATVSSPTFDRVCRMQPDGCAGLRVIWRSPLIPNDPLLWRRDLPADLKARVRAFFLAYGMPAAGKPPSRLAEERARLARIGISRFRASDDGQLLPIREIEAFKKGSAAATARVAGH